MLQWEVLVYTGTAVGVDDMQWERDCGGYVIYHSIWGFTMPCHSCSLVHRVQQAAVTAVQVVLLKTCAVCRGLGGGCAGCPGLAPCCPCALAMCSVLHERQAVLLLGGSVGLIAIQSRGAGFKTLSNGCPVNCGLVLQRAASWWWGSVQQVSFPSSGLFPAFVAGPYSLYRLLQSAKYLAVQENECFCLSHCEHMMML